MRIVEITHYMPPHMGGIERVAAALTDGLRARGHEVSWLGFADGAPPSDPSRVAVPAWNLLERRIGLPYPIWTPRALRTLVAHVQRAEVVHVHDCLYMGSAMAALSCARAGRPLLVTQHVGYVPFGAALDRVQGLAYRTLGRAVLSAADARVSCSSHVVDWLRSAGIDAPFAIIPNAVGTERFAVRADRSALRRARGIGDGARVVLFVGRLVDKKGIRRVLAARGAFETWVVGDGVRRDEVERAGVRFDAQIPAEQMGEVYAAADLLVLPSHGEGLPLTVQEALLSGLPVVVSDDPSFTANLAGMPGVTFVRDEEDLGAALDRAPALDREVVANAARARWSTDAFLDAYEAVLSRLAEGGSR